MEFVCYSEIILFRQVVILPMASFKHGIISSYNVG